MAVFIKKVNIPQKSDLINIDMTGSGTAQTYRVIKNVGGSVVEVMSMSDGTKSAFGETNTYAGSTIDTYLNTTLYGTLSNDAKQAIVDKTFAQDSWYINDAGTPKYITSYSGYVSLGSASYGTEITRHIYLISIQDVIDYVGATPEMQGWNTTLTQANLWTLFWNQSSAITPNVSVLFRSANPEQNDFANMFRSQQGMFDRNFTVYSNTVRPAFQIDLSKIDYTFTDGRQPVELKPVSILQKSNNALSRVGMSYKVPIIYPTKSDIVDIDMTGSGTAQRFRVLKNVGGSVVEVVSIFDVTSSMSFGTNTSLYEHSTLDNYINSTWYNTLSNTAKLAIVDKTFKQDSWFVNTYGSPQYTGINQSGTSYKMGRDSAGYGNDLIRHCYALSIQDIIDYLGVTTEMTASDTTLTAPNIWQMIWNASSQQEIDVWTRSSCANSSGNAVFISKTGRLSYNLASVGLGVRPAFQIDLSKIDFTIE